MSILEVQVTLRNSGIGQEDARQLARGIIPRWKYNNASSKGAIKKAQVLFDSETAEEFKRRDKFIKASAQK